MVRHARFLVVVVLSLAAASSTAATQARAAGALSGPIHAAAERTAWTATFPAGKARLVTNEYAFWNPSHPDAIVSDDWLMTSGSLFGRRGHGWSGKPDSGSPDARSRRSTGSAVFRLHTRYQSYGDVRVSFRLFVRRLASTRRTPAVAWDGVHVWLRYQSQRRLYVASVFRRDGRVLVKRKTPGGPSNGGTYETLGEEVDHPLALGRWHRVEVTVRTDADHAHLSIRLDGRLVDVVEDAGSAIGGPILTPGAIGIRGDNADFEFAELHVTSL